MTMSDSFCVYVLTFPNGKRYVGQTCQKPERRWAGGKGYSEQQPVRAAIEHFGWDNVLHEVFRDHLSHAEADDLEKLLIKTFSCDDIAFGYNILPGGVVNRFGFKNTEAQNRKIADSHKKRVKQFDRSGTLLQVFESVIDAAEYIGGAFRVISAVCNGDKKTGYGFVWRFENDEFGKFNSLPETGGVKGTPVIAFDADGRIVAKFRSSKHAAKMLNLDHGGILRCCRGKTGKYGGYIWKYDMKEGGNDDE